MKMEFLCECEEGTTGEERDLRGGPAPCMYLSLEHLITLDYIYICIYSEHSFSVSVFPCFSDLDLDFSVSVFVCSDLVFGFQEFLPGISSFSWVDLGGVFWFRIFSHSLRFTSLSF